MTTTYLNSVKTEDYLQAAFSYIADSSFNINESARVVGISAGAIAGPKFNKFKDTRKIVAN